jgi:hypothetical protein
MNSRKFAATRIAGSVCAAILLAACRLVAVRGCETPISEPALRLELANSPYFSNGVPGPGRVMRVERHGCGYRVHVGQNSADEFSGDVLIVDAKGKVLQIIEGY